MHPFTRRGPAQLVDRPFDPVPHGPAFDVAGCQQLVGVLGRV